MPREGEQLPPKPAALVLRRDEELIEVIVARLQGQHRRQPAVVVGNEKVPAAFDLARDPGRRLASRKLLASARPVETQLSIQIRAMSSYSSGRAGRMFMGGFLVKVGSHA
jgi:hypothetical protein